MTTSRFMQMAAAGVTPPPATDPDFEYVTLLLPGNGTNGAQNNTFIDNSTNNFTVTRNGTPTQGSFGPFSEPDGRWSTRFSSNSSLRYPANTGYLFGTGDFTVECWYYQSSIPPADAGVVTSQDGSFPHNWQLLTNSSNPAGNRLTWAWWGTYNTSTSLPLFENNKWYHLAVTRSGTTTRLFVNGILGHSFTDTRDYNASKPLNISGTNTAVLGISNVRIVKGTALYTSNFTPSTVPLTAVTNTTFLGCQSNNFRDNSATNATATIVGTCVALSFNPFQPTDSYNVSTQGGGGQFKGSGDYLSLASSSAFGFGTQDLTVEMWVYPTTSKLVQMLFDTRDNGQTNQQRYNFQLEGQTNGRRPQWSVGTTTLITASKAVPANQWSHLAYVRNGSTLTIYLNGESVGTATNSADVGTTASPVIGTVGDARGTYDGYFVGSMANLRVVKGTAVYTSNFTPPTAPVSAISGTSLLLNFANAGIADAAAINNMQTVSGAQVSTVQSKWGGGSLLFNGTSDLLYLIDSPALNLGGGDFTIECWMYPTNTSGTRGIIVKRKSDGAETGTWGLGMANGTVVFQDLQTPAVVVSFGTVSANAWTHVAITRQGTTVRGFLNGTLAATGTSSLDYVTTRAAFIGLWGTTGGVYPSGTLDGPYAGYIDDLRVTVGVARYTASFTAPTAPFPTL